MLRRRQGDVNGQGSQGTARGEREESLPETFSLSISSVRWPVTPHEPSATGCSILGHGVEMDSYQAGVTAM